MSLQVPSTQFQQVLRHARLLPCPSSLQNYWDIHPTHSRHHIIESKNISECINEILGLKNNGSTIIQYFIYNNNSLISATCVRTVNMNKVVFIRIWTRPITPAEVAPRGPHLQAALRGFFLVIYLLKKVVVRHRVSHSFCIFYELGAGLDTWSVGGIILGQEDVVGARRRLCCSCWHSEPGLSLPVAASWWLQSHHSCFGDQLKRSCGRETPPPLLGWVVCEGKEHICLPCCSNRFVNWVDLPVVAK